ncbi:hypothetical protein ACHAXN_000162, partial [Cyclotella atomus]
QEFYSNFLKVTAEGDADQFFEEAPCTAAAGPSEAPQDVPEPIDESVFAATNTAEDIALVWGQGLDVDDDNEPAPENIPQEGDATAEEDTGLYLGQRWGWDSLDPRRTSNTSVLNETNKAFADQRLNPITLGELIRLLGLVLLMAAVGAGFSQEDFWKPYHIKTNPCPYNLNKFMSCTRFKCIQRELQFTDAAKPTFVDRFWEVPHMILQWNQNMAEVFAARWVKCLDKSMSIWTNRWTCLGWVFRPRKPWPFGNEYHSAFCALCGLMFSIELVEGKDRPAQLRNQKYDAYGKTAGLLLRMLETYFASGRYAVLDSGFCVLKAILALMTVGGLFAGALIKKRRYWPLLVPGPAMDDRFATKAVGEVEAIQGFDVASNTPYFFWCMKESDYVMRIMATGGSLITDDTCKIAHRGVGANRVSFPYMKPYD